MREELANVIFDMMSSTDNAMLLISEYGNNSEITKDAELWWYINRFNDIPKNLSPTYIAQVYKFITHMGGTDIGPRLYRSAVLCEYLCEYLCGEYADAALYVYNSQLLKDCYYAGICFDKRITNILFHFVKFGFNEVIMRDFVARVPILLRWSAYHKNKEIFDWTLSKLIIHDNIYDEICGSRCTYGVFMVDRCYPDIIDGWYKQAIEWRFGEYINVENIEWVALRRRQEINSLL